MEIRAFGGPDAFRSLRTPAPGSHIRAFTGIYAHIRAYSSQGATKDAKESPNARLGGGGVLFFGCAGRLAVQHAAFAANALRATRGV